VARLRTFAEAFICVAVVRVSELDLPLAIALGVATAFALRAVFGLYDAWMRRRW